MQALRRFTHCGLQHPPSPLLNVGIHQWLRCLTVAVGVSGGVDSAVAAMLLKQQGHTVFGIFMRNWDEAEETGNKNCSVERDLKDAQAVCRQLNIPLQEVDFVSKYWNHVFAQFIAECSRGLTPNPDLACNRFIKFDALIQHAQGLGADAVATGHYARLIQHGGGLQLHKGADVDKDQSYFLASISPAALPYIRFPLGDMLKTEVRRLAAEAGLVPAEKRSSAGICFIGRRDFGDFLTEYVPPRAGIYVDVDAHVMLGVCPNVTVLTVGQRPGISGLGERSYVVGKDLRRGIVFVGSGRNHPALSTRTACLRTPHWLSTSHQALLEDQGELRCQYRARYRQPPEWCTVKLVRSPGDAATFQASKFCVLGPEDSAVLPGYLLVEFDQPAKAITPQQAFVMYDGDWCLGSASIAFPGRTDAEQNVNIK